MELFKLVGQMVIEGVDKAKADISSVGDEARDAADVVDSSNRHMGDSNATLGTSWSNLRTTVAQYKQDGMSTSQAWRTATQEMKSNAESMGNGTYSSFAKIGLAIGTFLAVDKILAFGQGCIQAASDVQAMESQFTQVFGELESQASSGLAKIAENAGISENRLKGSFTKIAAFAKTTGADTATSLNISERAMVAVADSAAFYDRSIEDVTESLQSFLKGKIVAA